MIRVLPVPGKLTLIIFTRNIGSPQEMASRHNFWWNRTATVSGPDWKLETYVYTQVSPFSLYFD